MRFLGAKVVLTPARRARHRHDRQGQSNSPRPMAGSNPAVRERGQSRHHSRTTAREIVDDFAGEKLDYWVTGYGTGGTLKGVARVLAKERPDDQNRRVRARRRGDAVERRRRSSAQADGSPAAGASGLQAASDAGLGAGLHSKADGRCGRVRGDRPAPAIQGPDAIRCSRELAQKEGIFVGITSGATFAGALAVWAEAPKGATILCMLPDTGERYLSTPLFADISADMSEEEIAISRSTPGNQMKPAA